MMNLGERLERSDIPIQRIGRLADVQSRKLYGGGPLSPAEIARVEAVLEKAAAGQIAPGPRRVRFPGAA